MKPQIRNNALDRQGADNKKRSNAAFFAVSNPIEG
jgi:hypothetical protein